MPILDDDDATHGRRTFLLWLGASSGAVLTGCAATPVGAVGSDAGADAVAPDAAIEADTTALPPWSGSCVPTTEDALGPFYVPGSPAQTQLAGPNEPGQRLLLMGTVFDPACSAPVVGATVELWHADAVGAYHDDKLRGQLVTGDDGRYGIDTIVPGRYLQNNGLRPAHVHVRITHPNHAELVTQIYFAGDPYLGLNDSCEPCTSEDVARHAELVDTKGVMVGMMHLALS